VLAPRQLGPGFAPAWLGESAASGMPVDVRLWLEQPPRASHAACYAVRAAAEQGFERPMLRRLREGFAVQRRALETVEGLVELAREVPGLELRRFAAALSSSAVVEALGVDLERGRGVVTPSLVVAAGEPIVDPASWRAAVLAAGAMPQSGRPAVAEALARWPRLATVEVAAVCELPYAAAAAALWVGVTELRVAVTRTLGGELWSATA
jgi:hypothetical protein